MNENENDSRWVQLRISFNDPRFRQMYDELILPKKSAKLLSHFIMQLLCKYYTDERVRMLVDDIGYVADEELQPVSNSLSDALTEYAEQTVLNMSAISFVVDNIQDITNMAENDINNIVESVKEIHQRSMTSEDKSISTELSTEEPVNTNIDRLDRLEQKFENLFKGLETRVTQNTSNTEILAEFEELKLRQDALAKEVYRINSLVAPVQPVTPVQTVQTPVQPVIPTQPVTPVQTVQTPVQPVISVQPVAPVQTPVQPVTPVQTPIQPVINSVPQTEQTVTQSVQEVQEVATQTVTAESVTPEPQKQVMPVIPDDINAIINSLPSKPSKGSSAIDRLFDDALDEVI